MKHFGFLIVVCGTLIFASACHSGEKATTKMVADTVTSIEFEHKNYSFGAIPKGQIVEHTYFFKNTGNVDLIIDEVDPSCGCTTPEWTKEPVKPGERGKIRVKFDTQHQSYGNKTKQVAVYSNTVPSRNLLQFTAQVVEE
ncbi:MAG: DUF1573 domain-containing protein [Bacteroidales bacterium]|nr:DUF1573 domain-containing protein [Bacteroidales bacterium]